MYYTTFRRFTQYSGRSYYNCSISFDGAHSVGPDLAGYVQRCFAGGLIPFNMVYCGSSNVNCSMAFSGYFYPLTELSEYIDLTDFAKYGNANLLECCMADGIPYGVVPAHLPELGYAFIKPIFIINEDLLTQYGFSDPRDLYEQKIWTWDALDKITDEFFTQEGSTTIYSLSCLSISRSIIFFDIFFDIIFCQNALRGLLYDRIYPA